MARINGFYLRAIRVIREIRGCLPLCFTKGG